MANADERLPRRVAPAAARLWSDHRLTGLLILALAGLVLGFVGYKSTGYSWVNSMYYTLSLLALSFQKPSGHIPLSLELARFLIPAVAAYATLRGLLTLFREQADLFRAQHQRGHVIVAGLGRRGLQFAKALRSSGRKVVAIEADAASASIEEARRSRAQVIVGDAADPDVLRRAGLARAQYLVALSEDDDLNAAVAALASNMGRADLQVLAHITRAPLADELTSVSLGREEGARVEWFNIYELAARELLSEHRIFGSSEIAPHLAIVGLHDLAASIVVNASRQWFARSPHNPRRLRISVAGEGATEWQRRLREENPALAEVTDLRAHERHPTEDELADVAAVFICERDDSSSVALAFTVARRVPPSRPVIVRLPVKGAGFAELLEGAEREIHVFGIAERVLTADLLEDTRFEAWARMVRERYEVMMGLEERGYASENDRAQARDIPQKLRAVGCWFRPAVAWTKPPLEFADDEVELLGRLEKERWNNQRRGESWCYGPEKRVEEKLTPYLLEWDDPRLPENVKDWDRDFVRDIPRWLATTGFEVYRVAAAPDEHGRWQKAVSVAGSRS